MCDIFAISAGYNYTAQDYLAVFAEKARQNMNGWGIGFFRDGADAARLPAQPLRITLRDPRFLLFLASWIGLNALFGFGTISFGGEAGQDIAWQAHVGGFFAGLFLFKAFDPVQPSPELSAEPSA